MSSKASIELLTLFKATDFTVSLLKFLIAIVVLNLIKILWNQYWFTRKSGFQFMPYQLPLFGHLFLLIKNAKQLGPFICNLCSKLPSPIGGWFLNYFFVVIYGPEDMEIVWNKCLNRGVGYNFFSDLFGVSLITVSAEKWKLVRKTLNPTFNPKILNAYVEPFSKNTITLSHILKKYQNERLDLYKWIHTANSANMIEFIMGSDSEFSKNETVQYGQWISSIVDGVVYRITHPFYIPEFIYENSTRRKKDLIPVREMRNFLELKIGNLKTQIKHQVNDDFEPLENKCFLEKLVEVTENNPVYTNHRIMDETSSVMFAGTHTSSATVFFTLILIAMDKNIQDKLYKELLEVIGSDRQIEYTDLPNLKYLDRVVKESLRIFPVGGMLIRRAHEQLMLHNGSTVPKDTMLFLNLRSLHMAPKSFPNPKVFDPDRFLPEEVAKRHPYAYIPFGAGPRNCIGGKLATMTVMTMVATLVLRFEFHTECKTIDDVQTHQDIQLQPTDGTQLTYKLRM